MFLLISCRLISSDAPKRAFRGASNAPLVELKLSQIALNVELSTSTPSPLHSTHNGSTPSGMPNTSDRNMLSSAGPSLGRMRGMPTLLPTRASISPASPTAATTTVSPSSFVTSVPTMRCHDKPTYKSPINALTCEDHRGTNCAHWHYLGLNTTQLARLIEDCPVTCRVPCGSFLQFSVALGFTLVAVPGLMDATTKKELEVATWQHLLAFSRAKLDREVAFEFDKVELLSQAIRTDMPSKQTKGKLQLSLSLALQMQFQGFTIGVSRDDVSTLLLTGIRNDSYQVALKEVDDFFSEAVMSSSLEDEAAVLETGDNHNRSSFSPMIIFSTVAVMATLLGISMCMNPTHSGRWLQTIDILHRLEIEYFLHFTSPPRFFEIATPSPISHPGTPLSLADSRASTFHVGNGVPLGTCTANQTVTVVTSSSDPAESTPKIESDQLVGCTVISSVDVPSPKFEVEAEMEHALSEAIPPMIIFDDIDNNLGGQSNATSDPQSPQVPGRLIKASNSLISFLCSGKGNADPSIL